MISNQILQTTIEGLKSITKHDMTVVEREGKVCASTEESMMNRVMEGIGYFVSSQAENQLVQGYQYFKVMDNGVTEYVINVKGDDDEAYKAGKIAAFQLQTLIVAYKERFDKDNFVKNLLLDNLLLVDIYGRAKKLRIDNNARRIVYLIDAEAENDINLVEKIRGIFPTKAKDFVTAVDERNIILVKELREKDETEEIEAVAGEIAEILSADSESKVRVAIGTVVLDLKNISNSYKEAKMALEVGKIFDENASIINYEKLGIGRLIYQLPITLCRIFINEVLHGINIEQMEAETLETVNKFFENNLNVSETSRQLYIHRNTLVYRLDKLQKLTGLDLRNFDAAIVFKITLMVNRYLNYRDKYMY